MATKKINTDLQLTAKLLDTSGDAGTSNQVLVSTATGINWVDGSGSGIIGGPYLPLAGGTMTGNLSLGSNNLTAGKLIVQNQINTNSANLEINYQNGDGTTTNYKDFYIRDGKNNVIMVVDGSARSVGIGVISPSYKLDVAGTSRSDLHIFRSNQSAPTADAFIFRPADNTVALGTANTERVRINTSGNVGIGITSPQARLSLGSSQGDGIDFLYDSTNNYKNQIKSYWNSSTDSRIDFNIGRTSGQTPQTIMSVGYGENVGIGTTTPGEKLEVNGVAAASGFKSNNFSVGVQGFSIESGDSAVTTYRFDADKFRFYSGNYGEIVSIKENGNVGINETNPGALLDIKYKNSSTNIYRASDAAGQYRWRVDQNFNMFMTNSSGGDTSRIYNDGSAYFGGVITFAAGASGVLGSRTGFADFLGYNSSYGSYIGGGAANASGKYLYAGGYINDSTGVYTLWHANNDGAGSGLDADLLDGQQGSYYAAASHNHDSDYVNVTGDTMTGNLTIANNNSALLNITGANSSYTSAAIKNTGTGNAILWFDAANGDLAGSDYASVGQHNDLNLVLNVGTNGGDIVFQESGGETMRIHDGNVGIGTTNPQSDLDVEGIIRSSTSSTEYGMMYYNLGEFAFYSRNGASKGDFEFIVTSGASSTSAMRIWGTGNVGQMQLPQYGGGTITGTATKMLAVDSSGRIIEETLPPTANQEIVSIKIPYKNPGAQTNYLTWIAGSYQSSLDSLTYKIAVEDGSLDKIKVMSTVSVTGVSLALYYTGSASAIWTSGSFNLTANTVYSISPSGASFNENDVLYMSISTPASANITYNLELKFLY